MNLTTGESFTKVNRAAGICRDTGSKITTRFVQCRKKRPTIERLPGLDYLGTRRTGRQLRSAIPDHLEGAGTLMPAGTRVCRLCQLPII